MAAVATKISLVLAMIGTMLVIGTVAEASPIEDAVAAGAANAEQQGITSYISVVDRTTGAVVSETANAHTQVASESIMKLFIAGYYAVQAGGSDSLSAGSKSRLEYMVEYSDDSTATSLFSSAIVPSQAARYGLTETTNATDRVGHWGAVRITAHDMAKYMFAMSQDPAVGPWLLGVMANVKPNGSDGFDQHFGFNALDGVHGSKQGWGGDGWGSRPYTINSVGYTDRWFGAILESGTSGVWTAMPAASTYAAKLIQAALPRDPSDPFGSIDQAQLATMQFRLSGWAFDPDNTGASVSVDVYDSGPQGLVGQRLTADGARPDVNAAYRISGDHGYATTLQLGGGGAHHICAYAINLGAGVNNTLLGCKDVVVPDPLGALDEVTSSAVGSISVRGWSFDPASPGVALDNHIYVTAADGSVAGYPGNIGAGNRTDVSAAFPGTGDSHGFTATVPVTAVGPTQVCAYAIGVGTTPVNVGIGCRTITVQNAFGALDSVTAGNKSITVTGWALNPNNRAESVQIHLYDVTAGTVIGRPGNYAGSPRADVDAAFGYGVNHGYSIAIPAVAGDHQVCAFAITTGGGIGNSLLGCRSVSVS